MRLEMKNGNHGRHGNGLYKIYGCKNFNFNLQKWKLEVVIPLHWPTLCRQPLCWLFLSIDYVKTRTSGTGGKNWLFCFPSSFPNTGDCIALLHFGSLVLLASKEVLTNPKYFYQAQKSFKGLKICYQKSLGFCASDNNEEKETSEGKTMLGPSNLCWNILIADVSDFCCELFASLK